MATQVEQLEAFSPPDNFETLLLLIKPYMGDRLDQQGKMPWHEPIDSSCGLFPWEIKHLKDLSEAYSYMDAAAKSLVMKAAVYSVIALQNIYRESTHPCFDHLASGCLEMAVKYQPDEITLASAILHDTSEENRDFWDTYIAKAMPQEIVQTVTDLSKFKGRRQREEIVDEEARLQIVGALLDNPRVPFIKIVGDRINNMSTLEYLRSLGRRRAIIDETQQMYVPLSGILGLKKEELVLDDLCLRQLGEEYAQFADVVSLEIDKFYAVLRSQAILSEIAEIQDLVQGGALELFYRKPSAHDIYRKMGKIKTVLVPSDYYLNIDAILTRFPQEVAGVEWAREAMEILNILAFNRFNVDENFNLSIFQKELQQGLTDSLAVDLVREKDGLNIHLTIYPQLAYDREQATIADMYYHRPPKSLEEETKLAMEGDDVARRHLRGMVKANYLKERYERIRVVVDQSYALVRLLEPRTPEGKMRIVGLDDNGRMETWQVTQGATVIDYAKSIFSEGWTRVIAAEVKRGNRLVTVPFDYILSPGETVHIVRRKKGKVRWDPFWIHSFRTDSEGKERTRVAIKAIVEREKADGRSDMRNRVIEVGRQMIERYFDPLSRPLWIDVSYVTDVIEECCPTVAVNEFEFMVGMGEIEEERVKTVAEALEPINRKVGIFRVNFTQDYPGQTEAVTEVLRLMDISALGSTSGRVSREGPSFVEFYIDPKTLEENDSDSIIRKILRDAKCRSLTMRTLGFTTSGKTEIYSVRKQRR